MLPFSQVLGFPAPGHPFWEQPTALSQAIGRYPALDPEPYINAGADNVLC